MQAFIKKLSNTSYDFKMLYWGVVYQRLCKHIGKALLNKQRSVSPSYVRKAKAADLEFNAGVNPGGDGPVVAHLRTFGRVRGFAVSVHGVSEDVICFLKYLADKAGHKRWRLMGARSPAEAKSVYYNQFRQQLGIVMARSLSRLMFDRLNHVVYGPNHEDAARHAHTRAAFDKEEEWYYNRHGPEVSGIGEPPSRG